MDVEALPCLAWILRISCAERTRHVLSPRLHVHKQFATFRTGSGNARALHHQPTKNGRRKDEQVTSRDLQSVTECQQGGIGEEGSNDQHLYKAYASRNAASLS